MVNIRYSKGNLTIKDLSEEYGVSTRTIYRKLTKSYKEELPSLLIRPILIRQNEMYRFCKTKCDFFVQNEMC